jgi:signal transduction histidine kinase
MDSEMITLAVVTTGWLLALSLAAALWRQQRQRRRLEKLLEKMKAEKSQKGRFLAHVAHEIRTPLNGITGLATLLAQSDLTPQEERRLKGHLSASAQQLMDLVNDVLDSSKLEEGRMVLVPEDFIVRNWIESVVYPQKGLARKKGVSIEVTYEGDSRRTLRADVGKLTDPGQPCRQCRQVHRQGAGLLARAGSQRSWRDAFVERP